MSLTGPREDSPSLSLFPRLFLSHYLSLHTHTPAGPGSRCLNENQKKVKTHPARIYLLSLRLSSGNPSLKSTYHPMVPTVKFSLCTPTLHSWRMSGSSDSSSSCRCTLPWATQIFIGWLYAVHAQTCHSPTVEQFHHHLAPRWPHASVHSMCPWKLSIASRLG